MVLLDPTERWLCSGKSSPPFATHSQWRTDTRNKTGEEISFTCFLKLVGASLSKIECYFDISGNCLLFFEHFLKLFKMLIKKWGIWNNSSISEFHWKSVKKSIIFTLFWESQIILVLHKAKLLPTSPDRQKFNQWPPTPRRRREQPSVPTLRRNATQLAGCLPLENANQLHLNSSSSSSATYSIIQSITASSQTSPLPACVLKQREIQENNHFRAVGFWVGRPQRCKGATLDQYPAELPETWN